MSTDATSPRSPRSSVHSPRQTHSPRFAPQQPKTGKIKDCCTRVSELTKKFFSSIAQIPTSIFKGIKNATSWSVEKTKTGANCTLSTIKNNKGYILAATIAVVASYFFLEPKLPNIFNYFKNPVVPPVNETAVAPVQEQILPAISENIAEPVQEQILPDIIAAPVQQPASLHTNTFCKTIFCWMINKLFG